MEKPNYYAILTADVRYDKDLIANAKLLYSEITALCNMNGHCHAGDAYFAELFGVSKQSIQKWLKQLEEKNYISRKVKYKKGTKQIECRYTTIVAYPTQQNACTPTQQKLGDNNNPTDSINTTLTESNSKKDTKVSKKGCRFDFKTHVSDEWYSEAKRLKPQLSDLIIQEEVEKFNDYWTSKTGQGATKIDWLATWRNWIRNSKQTSYTKKRTQIDELQQFMREGF